MERNYLHVLRRITQILFIFFIVLIPVLNIFRFDSATGTLILFGNDWDLGLKEGFYLDRSLHGASHVAFQFFLKAILPWLGILAVFPLLGALTGRFFCGWFCPEGALFELFDFFTVKIFGRRSLFARNGNEPGGPSEKRILYAVFAGLCLIVIPFLGGIALTGYFVHPKTLWDQLINWEFTFGVKAGIFGVALYVMISSLIIRHTLCKYICSAGLMQMLFGWASPVSLRIKVDTARLSECTDCRSCERVCFMDVKPRLLKKDISCVNCGECIQACNKELGKGKGLFGFSQSKPSTLPPAEKTRGRPFNVVLNHD
jgi:polyferredoxin